jgi:ribonuclease Y
MLLLLAALLAIAAAVIAALVVANLSARAAAEAAAAERVAAEAAAAADRVAATSAAVAIRTAAESAARRETLATREAAVADFEVKGRAIATRRDQLARAVAEVASRDVELTERAEALTARERELQSSRDRAAGVERDAGRRGGELRKALERSAGTTGDELARRMQTTWLDDARAAAADAIRTADQAAADPALDREAPRIMELAIGRYQYHFLTERNVSNLRLGPQIVEAVTADGGVVHAAIEQVANVRLLVNDDHDAIRLDGQDGVGKEVARRALGKLLKKPESIDEARKNPVEWAQKFRTHLEQEIRQLGKKAFQVLEIQRPHQEIVDLVGALNFRTSYTQNQWMHAVEASFLAGIMAAELGLDEKLARRATLMHDIGKALTHKIEGSHAVIGAEIARRLGEPEIIANAIGAHHTDEPFNSPYAYLVAAADAMSGARPGARREQTEGFSTKIEDLERIGESYRGVDHAHAVFGGRELRVYVRERDVDDLRTVELSSEIAARVADELTFPGQIKVTVIRAFEAVSTAN